MALGLLAVMMLCPAPMEGVSAEEATIKASVTVQPVLGLTVGSDNYVVNVTPTETGEFSSRTATVEVTTNNETGYSLYLATENQQATLANAEGTAEIAPVSGEVMATGFGANTWGYNLGKEAVSEETMYQAVPTQNGEPAGGSEVPVEGDEYNLTFGAFVNTELPGGAYSNRVVVSAVVNPGYVPTLSAIDNMQEMTAEICQASTENETKQLTDTRDGKKYWVAKLADGNCWMTQNLDLDLGVKDGDTDTTVLTPADSDVSSNWNPPRSTEKNGTVTSNSDNTETYSWDFGLYVKNNPDDYGSYCDQVKTMSGCEGWTDVTNLTPAETEWTGSVDNTVSGNTYDAHFLIGNFYQWNAATAGTGRTTSDYANATDSICPKGWRLPISRSGREFDTLVGDLDSTTITQAPYYFNPSGQVGSGSLRKAGYRGDYWSSTQYPSIGGAYNLYFRSGYVDPSASYVRYAGLSVRCLASQ